MLLAINCGSSSVKASLFLEKNARRDFKYQHIGHGNFNNHADALRALISDLADIKPSAIVHRFVHGGELLSAARLIDADERMRLDGLMSLAPLHMQNSLLAVDLLKTFNCPQYACFDTAFHATLPEIAYRLPIPQSLNLRRYGFHGINYAHIARELPQLLGTQAKGLIVVAHLGNGASLCLLENLCSVDTTMGYSAAGGIPMGTRSGDIDPGVMLELAKRYDLAQLTDLVYHQMGLIALSNGASSEMNVLEKINNQHCKFSMEYFSHQVRGAIGSFAAKSGGIDGIVFTGGIGEHSHQIRALICNPLAFLGFYLDESANINHQTILNTASSKPILMVAADEEGEMAKQIMSQLIDNE